MKETDPRTRAQYEKVRDEFAHLGIQDKTAFVLEATFDTLGEVVREAGKTVSDLFERVSKDDFWTPPTAADEASSAEASEAEASEAEASEAEASAPPPAAPPRKGKTGSAPDAPGDL